jgi:PST family polysaccharide transporter
MGPARFGAFSYINAVIAVFVSLSTLGLDYVVVCDLVKDVHRKAHILGTTLAMRLCGGFMGALASNIVIFVARPHNKLFHLLGAILGSGAIFQAFDTIDLWFQSQVQSKYSVIVRNSAFAIMACVKVALVLMRASLVAFAWALLGEAAIGAFFFVIVYGYTGEKISEWRVDRVLGMSLLRVTWPLILSGLAIMISVRTDQIMLGQMGSDKAVGIFTAASRLTELWYFLPVGLVTSVMPTLVEAKQAAGALYSQRFQKLFRLMVILALAIVLPTTLFARHVVVRLYGPAFADGGPILAIQIWSAIFVFLGVAQGPWFVLEGLTKLSLTRTLGLLGVNVGLNFVLIPRYGGVGAAVSSLAAQLTCNLLINYINPRTRALFWMEMRAFMIWSRWSPRAGGTGSAPGSLG